MLLEVVLDDSEIVPTTNDAGWTVTLTTARVAAASLQFTILGEMHAATAWLPRVDRRAGVGPPGPLRWR